MSHVPHRKAAPKTVRCYVLTISDTRTEATDSGGRILVDLLTNGGHEVLGKTIVPDEPARVREAVEAQLADPSVQVVVTTGGTGISRRDQTYEAITGVLDKRIDGFGELFRGAEPPGGRHGRHAVARLCRHGPRQDCHLRTGVGGRRAPGGHQAHPAGDRASGARGVTIDV